MQTFIQKAKDIHGDRYDYSKVEYKNTHTKVEVLCPTHGSFFPRPMDHVNKQSGCPECSGRKRRTTKTFIEDAKTIHGNKYDYSQAMFTNFDTKLTIICKQHGTFNMTPRAHLVSKQGCCMCGRERIGNIKRKPLGLFVEQASTVHNNKYDYSLVTYKNNKTKITILCPEHGQFQQPPDNHLSGQGCPTCGKALKGGTGSYSHEYFSNNPNQKLIPGVLYVAEITNHKDHFLKIGITCNDLKTRYASKKPASMRIIPIVEHQTTLFDAFLQEQHLLVILKPYRYFPNNKFGGYTECFKVTNEVKDILDQHFQLNNGTTTIKG